MAEPKRIDRYEILSEIGHGGIATVYKARDPCVQREVAIKVLPREFLNDLTFPGNFYQNARTIAALVGNPRR